MATRKRQANEKGGRSVSWAPLDALELEDELAGFYNPRTMVDDAALAQLADSIFRHGVLQPLLVWRNGDRYVVVEGGRRVRALRLLVKEGRGADLSDVPIVVLGIRSTTEAMAVSIEANEQRQSLSNYDIALQVKRMRERGMTQAEVATSIGRERQFVNRLLGVLKRASPELLEAWKAQTLKEKIIYRLSFLAMDEQPAALAEALEAPAAAPEAPRPIEPPPPPEDEEAEEPQPQGRRERARPTLQDVRALREKVKNSSTGPGKRAYRGGFLDALEWVLGDILLADCALGDEVERSRAEEDRRK